MQTIKEFPYLLIIWDPDSRGLITQWRGGYQGRNIKEGLLAGLEVYKKRLAMGGGAQWIGDVRDIGVIGLEEQEWIDKEWFPKFLATGVKYMAVVQPTSAVAKISVKSIVSKIPGTKLTQFACSTLEEAQEWIKKQKF
jgi:hypothetical protein